MIDDDTLALALLAHRLQRTAFDLSAATGGLEQDKDEQPIGARAVVNAVLAAVNLIDAHRVRGRPAAHAHPRRHGRGEGERQVARQAAEAVDQAAA
jgi:hypothetical protein